MGTSGFVTFPRSLTQRTIDMPFYRCKPLTFLARHFISTDMKLLALSLLGIFALKELE